MSKKNIAVLLASVIILSACGGKNKEQSQKEKIDVSLFEENDKKRSKYKGYTVEDVYIDGKKVKIDVQSHGEHYHIIFNGKKYMISKEQYDKLKTPNNDIVLSDDNEEKSLSEINADEIESYFKHGDHWHIKLKDGSEIVTFDDPSKIAIGKERYVQTVSKDKLNSKEIVSKWKHGDHWHVRLADGTEYITYDNPNDISFRNDSNVSSKNSEIVEVVGADKLDNKKIVSIRKHGDHWHVKTADGKEYVTYDDPSGKQTIDEVVKGNPDNSGSKDNKEKEDLNKDSEKINVTKIVKHDDHYHVTINGREQIMNDAELKELERKVGTLPKIEVWKNEDIHENEQKKEFEMHLHGVKGHYHPQDEMNIEAHSHKEKDIVSYKWYVKRSDSNSFEEIKGQNGKFLKIKVTLKEHNSIIKVEAFDKFKNVIDTCSKKIEVIDHGSHDNEHISEKEPHVDMHFHGDTEYEDGEALQIYAHSGVKSVKGYKWFIKKTTDNDFNEIKGKTEAIFEMKVDLSFDKSILKAVAVDTSGKVVDHYAVELSVSEAIDETSKNAENLMINDLKINPKIVELLKSKKDIQVAGNAKFPYDTKDKEKIIKFLSQVIYINLEDIENVENDPVMKYLNNIQGFSFSKNIDDKKINKLLDENKSLCKTLDYLSFNASPITNLQFLNKLNDFGQLELDSIDEKALTFEGVKTEKLEKLWKLYIQDSNITSVEFLKKMPKIAKLNLSNTKITDLSAVENLKELVIFTFTNNKTDNLSVLENCSNLQQLIIDKTTNTKGKQVDLSFVNNTKINTLLMKDCKTSDLTALNGNSNLKQLDASNSYDLKADKLPNLPNIEGINLSGTFMTSLKDIPIYPKLKALAMDRTGLENLEGIQNQPSLEMATFVGCMINTFEISSPAIKLRALSLTDNKISSWKGYKENFPNVKNVIVVNNPIHKNKPQN